MNMHGYWRVTHGQGACTYRCKLGNHEAEADGDGGRDALSSFAVIQRATATLPREVHIRSERSNVQSNGTEAVQGHEGLLAACICRHRTDSDEKYGSDDIECEL